MPGWNIADVWEAVADAQPDAPAQVQGGRRSTWRDFDRRADGVASTLLALGVARQDKVAQYLYNCPEYLESLYGAWKAALVPVNTNYRYAEDELVYLWDNADAVCVVFHGSFTGTIKRIRARVPRVRLWLWVDDGSGPCPRWATPYEEAAECSAERVEPEWGRDGDDLYMLYTGGTTGMPKGVMWRQDDIANLLNDAAVVPYPADATVEDFRRLRVARGPGLGLVPACPLMHGTGALISFGLLSDGGCVFLLPSRGFSADELFDTIEAEKANAVVIVGDTFAKPMLRALDAEPRRWDLSSLLLVYSSGVMWSEPVKAGLMRHHPGVLLVDALGSSEAIGMGTSTSHGEGAARTASFKLGDNAVVITEDDRLVEPGSGEVGRVGIRGRVPVGYYKDPEKSALTFPVIDGVRYSVPGDFATVEADGTVSLLGRGSVVINTGGEKVFPEEVEEAVKRHPGVRDAVAVGVADDRFGQAITAVVELEPGAELDEAGIIATVKASLAAYKAPKRVIAIDTIGRGPNAKVDYKRLTAYATERS
ncbi:MAG: AMP-binding protein [Actinomycetota bacterium]|nr:AMP-binding protein [Actinomycetota bacterium]